MQVYNGATTPISIPMQLWSNDTSLPYYKYAYSKRKIRLKFY